MGAGHFMWEQGTLHGSREHYMRAGHFTWEHGSPSYAELSREALAMVLAVECCSLLVPPPLPYIPCDVTYNYLGWTRGEKGLAKNSTPQSTRPQLLA